MSSSGKNARPHKNNRRSSILRPVQNAVDSEEGGKKEKRRVSFHNTKMIQNFEKEDAGLGLQGDPFRQKINETAGSDGVLSPGRVSHISGTSTDPNNTRAQMLSETLNNTELMFMKKTPVLEIESLENTAAHFRPEVGSSKDMHCHMHAVNSTASFTSVVDMDITIRSEAGKDGQLDSITRKNLDSTLAMFDRVEESNVTTSYPEAMDISQMNSTVLNNTVDMFSVPTGAAKKNRRKSELKTPKNEADDYAMDNTCAMFSSPTGVDKTNRTLFSGDMSCTTLNMDPEDTMLLFSNKTMTPLDETLSRNEAPSHSNEAELLNETEAIFPLELKSYSEPKDTSSMDITVAQEIPLISNDVRSSTLQKSYSEPKDTSCMDITVAQETAVASNDVHSSTLQKSYSEPKDTSCMDITVAQETTVASNDVQSYPMKINDDTLRLSSDGMSRSFVPPSNDTYSEKEKRDVSMVASSSEPKDMDVTIGQGTIVLSSDVCHSPMKRKDDTFGLGRDQTSRSFVSSTDDIRSENERRDVSMVSRLSLLNHSGLGDLKTISGKDSSIPSDSLNASLMSNRGKLRRRSNLVAQLDNSIRSEPRDVTKKNFDLNTSNNGGDTNSHSAETLMRIQRLLQFDPRSINVAVVEPVISQKFANIARKMMTEDLATAISSSLNSNKATVRDEISKVEADPRKQALTKLKFSDLDVVERDIALACRRLAEASWWESRNEVVNGHLERAISSNLQLEQQLEELDHNLYLVENSSHIIKETSRLKEEVADADCLFNEVNPEEVNKLLAAELELLNEMPSLELPQLHRGILEDCGVDVKEYEEAALGDDDTAFLKKLSIINALITEQDKMDKDWKKAEKRCREVLLDLDRRQERRDQKKRDLDNILVDMEEKLTALSADYSDVYF